MPENEYKPINLTKGKVVNYNDLLKKSPPINKDIQAQAHGPGEELAKLGIKGETIVTYQRDADGNLIRDKNGDPIVTRQFRPTEIPAYFQKALAALHKKEPCFFEGCEEIVENFQKELKAMESRPGGCSACQRGALQRKYANMIREKLPPEEANKIMQPTVPPHTVTNVATNEVVNVPRHAIPYATIRREIPANMQHAFTNKAKERKILVNGREVPIEPLLRQVQRGTTGATGGPEKTSD